MIDKKFTKGKWYLQKYTDAYTNIIRCDNGQGNQTIMVAHLSQDTSPTVRANARLMAASTDMLEALESCIRYFETNRNGGYNGPEQPCEARSAYDKAVKAILTATNEALNP